MGGQGTKMQPAKKQLGPLKLAGFDEIFNDMRQTFDQIAKRAYEIFEGNGRQLGRDLDDWLRAEREFLRPVPLELRESDESITVRAEVPGFEAQDLEIAIEGRQLSIAGKRETSKEEEKKKLLYSERRSNQLYRCVELPAEIDPEKSTATLKGGVLELTMPKTTPSKKIRIEPRAA